MKPMNPTNPVQPLPPMNLEDPRISAWLMPDAAAMSAEASSTSAPTNARGCLALGVPAIPLSR